MKRILYVVDGYNGQGGAHVATRMLIAALWDAGLHVDVLSTEHPNECHKDEIPNATFYVSDIPYHSFRWFVSGIYRRVFHSEIYPDFLYDPTGMLRKVLAGYDAVCVMTEESVFRHLVSRLPKRIRKIQLCHTNYGWWATRHRVLSWSDAKLYRRFDRIAGVGQVNTCQMKELLPGLADRITSFHNLIDQRGLSYHKKEEHTGPVRMATVARVEDPVTKDGWRMARIAQKLKEKGVKFVWHVYGGRGKAFDVLRADVMSMGIDSCFVLHGWVKDAREQVADSDLMVLLSHVEGLPNVIYESLLTGTPVISTNVGGISEQIQDGVNGWLVRDVDDEIVTRLFCLLKDRHALSLANERLSTFRYDNEAILASHVELLTGGVL